jgi:hypothetical protein
LFNTIPGVTIVASTLLPNANPKTQANVEIYNRKIPNVVRGRQTAGKQIVYVEFSSSPSSFSLSGLSADGTHPMDAGYIKMAEVWYQGIVAAKGRGWLSTKATRGHGVSNVVSGKSNDTSDAAAGTTNGPVKTQAGLGTTYVPAVSTLLFLLVSLQIVSNSGSDDEQAEKRHVYQQQSTTCFSRRWILRQSFLWFTLRMFLTCFILPELNHI